MYSNDRFLEVELYIFIAVKNSAPQSVVYEWDSIAIRAVQL